MPTNDHGSSPDDPDDVTRMKKLSRKWWKADEVEVGEGGWGKVESSEEEK